MKKMKFTIETEHENKLPFLDILISKRENNVDLGIYRKATFTGLGVNFMSACYENFKLNTFNTLFFRAYRLSSTYEHFDKEICFLKKFFNANGFTDNVFYGKVRKFLDKIYTPITKKHGCPKLNLYFRIPYLRDNTKLSFKEEIAKISTKYFKQIRPIVFSFLFITILKLEIL